jgi:hypothetical protein
LFFLAGCSEKGDITITSPTNGAKFHEDETLVVSVSANSTFTELKVATIKVNGVNAMTAGGGVFECILLPQETTDCAMIPLPKPGVHTITVEVVKNNGDIVSASTTFEWAPYSKTDKWALKIAGAVGATGPGPGYAILAGVMVVGVTLAALILTKASAVGAVVGFMTSMILLALGLYSTESAGAALTVANGIVTIAVLALIIAFLRGFKGGYSSVTDLNTGQITTFAGLVADGSTKLPGAAIQAGRDSVESIAKRHQLPSGNE